MSSFEERLQKAIEGIEKRREQSRKRKRSRYDPQKARAYYQSHKAERLAYSKAYYNRTKKSIKVEKAIQLLKSEGFYIEKDGYTYDEYDPM